MAAKDAHNPGTVSPELDEMVCDLIGLFLDALAEGEDPGVVLCVEDAGAHRYQAAFTEDGEEACLAAATAYVSEHAARGVAEEGVDKLDRYAIACTGCVQLEDGYQDAVLVSFCERALPVGYSAFVLFDGVGAGDAFMWSDPEPAGEEPSLF